MGHLHGLGTRQCQRHLTTRGTIAHGDVLLHRALVRQDTHGMAGDLSGLALHLERVLHAPADRVFAACVEPDQLSQWWGPAGFSTPSVELDVRAGGRYRITMQPPEGEVFHLRGQFSEVDPRRRLVYTFEWEEPDPDDQETLVSLSFIDGGERTELLVDQGPFATQARYELHEAGWTETLDRLAAYLA